MKLSISLIMVSFLLASCHSKHHESSKGKYLKLTQENNIEVPVIKLIDKEKFILWETKTGETFHVLKVWSKSKEQSCKNCHQGYSAKSITGKTHKRSHWNISLKHDSSNRMNCITCHDPNKVWQFTQGEKRNISANFAPHLCSQCHFKEKKDWVLGSHGKRENGWQGERAVKSCVSCHNPHSPAFEKRHPKVAPYRPINNEERL